MRPAAILIEMESNLKTIWQVFSPLLNLGIRVLRGTLAWAQTSPKGPGETQALAAWFSLLSDLSVTSEGLRE